MMVKNIVKDLCDRLSEYYMKIFILITVIISNIDPKIVYV